MEMGRGCESKFTVRRTSNDVRRITRDQSIWNCTCARGGTAKEAIPCKKVVAVQGNWGKAGRL